MFHQLKSFYRSRGFLAFHIMIGFLFCIQIAISLPYVFVEKLSNWITEFHAHLIAFCFLLPLGKEAKVLGNTICFAEGKVKIVLQCLTPEILAFLIFFVFLLSTNKRQVFQGILWCPLLFWFINMLRMASLVLIQAKSPQMFYSIHNIGYNIFMLLAAIGCLWIWLFKIRHQKFRGFPGKHILYFLIWAFSLSFLAQTIHLSIAPAYQEFIFSSLASLTKVKPSLTKIPHLLNFKRISILMAICLSLPNLHLRSKLKGIVAIVFFGFCVDIWLCYHLAKAYHLQILSFRFSSQLIVSARSFFHATSLLVTVVLISMSIFRRKNRIIEKEKQNLENPLEKYKQFPGISVTLFFLLCISPWTSLEVRFLLNIFCFLLWSSFSYRNKRNLLVA